MSICGQGASRRPVAIVGMAALFPGAGNLESYWQNILGGVDAITEVPAGRWDEEFYSADGPQRADRVYCRRGGFVDQSAEYDLTRFGIMPNSVPGTEPDQLIALDVAHQSIEDAGGEAVLPEDRQRAGVVLGRGGYLTPGLVRLDQRVRTSNQVVRTLRELVPELGEDRLEQVRSAFAEQLGPEAPESAIGLVPNLAASRVANRLDLRGPAYTVDAACASSLVAVDHAVRELDAGRCDIMLAGGVHHCHDITLWSVFSQLGALSRSQQIRPLHRGADGVLIGEGTGVVVLKRLEDAERDGDRVYAVISGTGVASDGRSASLFNPDPGGQVRAVRQAWDAAGLDPRAADAIGLIEAHGTATPAGDEAELTTLAEVFGPAEGHGEGGGEREGAGHGGTGTGGHAAIGSVKSMIGHTMPAAGIAGLIKAALAVHHGVLPPTLHCEQPHPRLAATRFRALGNAEPWPQPLAARVAAVNAFGFGGINAHVVLRGPAAASAPLLPAATPPQVLTLSADSAAELLARLSRGERDASPGSGPYRLAIVEPDARKLALAATQIATGKPWRGRQQIHFSGEGLVRAGGKIAFVFPGVDSTFTPRVTDLARHFRRPLPPHCTALNPATDLAKVVIGLLGCNRLLFDILSELGVRADAMAGHSVGEWSAMLAAGMLDQGLSDRTNASLDLAAINFPDAVFLAAACAAEQLLVHLEGLDDVVISHDNCPHQVIACGPRDAIGTLAQRLRSATVFAQTLPFVSGFHAPLFADHLAWYRDFFASAELAEPQVPVWSATTAAPFPRAAAAKRALAIEHLLQPVRFRELTEALFAAGHRVFIQVGTGSLTGFIGDTLSGRPHLAIAANQDSRSGLAQLANLCAALWVEGAEFDTRLLRDASAAPGAAQPVTLALGVPLLRVTRPLDLATGFGAPPAPRAATAPDTAANPVAELAQAMLADVERAGREIVELVQGDWQRATRERPGRDLRAVAAEPATAPPAPRHLEVRLRRTLDINTTIPEVADHELYPQRPGWPVAADRHPVVPLTMAVMLVREAAEAELPGLVVSEVRAVQAYNWLVVASPCTVEITLKSVASATREQVIGEQVIEAAIEGYFKAELVLAPRYPAAPTTAMAPLSGTRATAVAAADLYRDHWMFHGPSYQGITRFTAIGDDGIDGEVRVPPGKGALLDNMGQMAGYWVMEQPANCLAMPIGIGAIRWFDADPAVGETLVNQLRIRALDDLNCVSDHVLRDAQGRVRIAIDGWHCRRYQMDKAFWLNSRQLGSHPVSRMLAADVALFEDHYDTAILRDYLARRYLTAQELVEYDGLSPKRRREWLNGRVAVKDAVRSLLWVGGTAAGAAPGAIEPPAIYPKEMRIENDRRGVPRLRANVTATVPETLSISITHKDHLALAMVGTEPVAVDIERIETRADSFTALAFSAAERDLLLAGVAEDAAAAITRGWVAKEVAGKLTGAGIGSQLRTLVIEARSGDELRVNGRWIHTERLANHIAGWLRQ